MATTTPDPDRGADHPGAEKGSPLRLKHRIKRWPGVAGLVGYLEQHPRLIPASFFLGGFGWDALTLTRIDALFDNVLMLAYLAALCLVIYLGMLHTRRPSSAPSWIEKYGRWLPYATQFALGALLSANVIFYSQSASLTASSAFVIVLVALLVGNEWIDHQKNVYSLFALYFLASMSFFIFFVPVITKRMGYLPFFAAGLLAFVLCGIVVWALHRQKAISTRKEVALLFGTFAGLFILMNVLFVNRWIPPVPLAMRSSGVYHYVGQHNDGYRLHFVKPPWYDLWTRSDDPFLYRPRDTVYFFSSIFAPTDFEQDVLHEWARWDDEVGAWETTDRIHYEIEGGRRQGYRGFTFKRNVVPGKWRVDVKTASDLIIGRVRFKIVEAEAKPLRFREITR